MNHSVRLLFGAASLALFTACSAVNGDRPQAENLTCRSITHDVEQTEICEQPQNIAVLSPHLLDLLLSLDQQPNAYAGLLDIVQSDVFQNPDQQIPYLGAQITTQPVNLGNGSQPSMERLAALKPDLILGEAGRNESSYPLFSQIAPTLLWKDRTAEGKWQVTLKELAKALGKQEQAEQVIQSHEQDLAAAKEQFAPVVAEHPNVLILGSSDLQAQIAIIPPESYLGELFTKIGFQLVTLPGKEGPFVNVPVSVEALPQLNEADIVIVLGHNLDRNAKPALSGDVDAALEAHQLASIRKSWAENAIAQSLTASQEGRVYLATYYKWNGLNGPTGASLILKQLREFLLSNNDSSS